MADKLRKGDRIEATPEGRTKTGKGTVVRVFRDGNVAIKWDGATWLTEDEVAPHEVKKVQ
jgi:hypothetical protein